ncbi:hypothetical protein F4782DRAFT_372759 [Xylaria castorea]|nr:hypothetical protein F4782DRAFT_372759 [Xylaria castorea]
MGSNSETTPGLAPVSGAALFCQEIERRKRLHRSGVIPTGCSEIDDALLLGGGFEGGCVVGVSAEEVDFGLLLGLQTVARALVFEGSPNGFPAQSGRESKRRAAIITTLPVTTVLPTLRDIIRSQAQIKLGPRNPGIDAELRRCLEAISISRIFDIEGLWEVLRELEDAQAVASSSHSEDGNEGMNIPHMPTEYGEEAQESQAEDTTKGPADKEVVEEISAEKGAEQTGGALIDHVSSMSSLKPTSSSAEPVTQLPPLRIGPELRPPVRKPEVLDSEDDEPFSSSPLSSPPPSTVGPEPSSQSREHSQAPAEPDPNLILSSDPEPDPEPDPRLEESEVLQPILTENPPLPFPAIILVTHVSSLLNTLFTHNDKTSAHTSLQLLSSYLQRLVASTEALVMLLNTTTSPSSETSTSTSGVVPKPFPGPDRPMPPIGPETSNQQRPLDPTLRSIFNPGFTQLHDPNTSGQGNSRPGHGHSYSYGAATAAAARLTRRNKPSFGATFTQFLDLHLLCTKVPRTRDDAETAIALGTDSEDVRHAWIIEALLDVMGVWEWGKREVVSGDRKRDKGGKEEKEEEEGEPFLPPRVNREQRWGAVDVRDGVRVVNAFTAGSGSGGYVNRGPVRLAAGFGGPRV